MIRVHFVEFELERHGLEALPSCQHWNYPWWGKLMWKVEVPWLLVEGQPKMLSDFVVVVGVTSVQGT
jgi:hypothetical protein